MYFQRLNTFEIQEVLKYDNTGGEGNNYYYVQSSKYVLHAYEKGKKTWFLTPRSLQFKIDIDSAIQKQYYLYIRKNVCLKVYIKKPSNL